MRDFFINQLYHKAIKDKRILLITGDLGFGVLNDFISNLPNQFINAGVAEQNMTGLATGLAMEGYRVFTYSIGNFCSLRCLEHIRNDVCYHKANVKIISVGSGFGYGSLGMSHHATEDVAILRALPNLKIYSPSDREEVNALVDELIDYDGPTYIRLGKCDDRAQHNRSVNIHGCNQICLDDPSAITGNVLFLTHGSLYSYVEHLQSELLKEGVLCDAYTVPCLKPLNIPAIIDRMQSKNLIVTFEEHNLMGGFGSAIAEVIVDHQLNARLLRIGTNDAFVSFGGSPQYLREQMGLDLKSVINRIKTLL